MSYQLSDATRARFDREVAKYPYELRQSAVMACLAIVQQEEGYVPRAAEDAIAAHLGMAPIAVYEVTTFYNMYNQKPVGKFKLNVCGNLPCQLRDGQKALDHLCSKLGIEQGGTTADGSVTIEQVFCLGNCALSPAVMVGEKLYGRVDPERFDEIIAGLEKEAAE